MRTPMVLAAIAVQVCGVSSLHAQQVSDALAEAAAMSTVSGSAVAQTPSAPVDTGLLAAQVAAADAMPSAAAALNAPVSSVAPGRAPASSQATSPGAADSVLAMGQAASVEQAAALAATAAPAVIGSPTLDLVVSAAALSTADPANIPVAKVSPGR